MANLRGELREMAAGDAARGASEVVIKPHPDTLRAQRLEATVGELTRELGETAREAAAQKTRADREGKRADDLEKK
jgi:hypothetical protein